MPGKTDKDGEGASPSKDQTLPTQRSTSAGDDRSSAALPEELRELLCDLPAEERDKVARIASIIVSSHEGPLPDAQDFEHYERTKPGAASEIIEMAKREQTIKESVLTGRVSNDRLRLSNDRLLVWALMVSVVGMIGVAGLAVWLKQPQVAMFLTGLSAVVGLGLRLISVFAKKSETKKDE